MSEANSGMTLHSLVSDVTVSHAIVILLNNPLSRAILTFLIPLIASVYKPAFSNDIQFKFSSTLCSNVSRSTRINSSSVHTYIFSLFHSGQLPAVHSLEYRF